MKVPTLTVHFVLVYFEVVSYWSAQVVLDELYTTGLKFEAILLPQPPEISNFRSESLCGVDLCFFLVVILHSCRRMFCLPENTTALQKSCTCVPGSQVTGLFSNNLVNHADLNSKFETVSPNKHKAITQAAFQFSETAITRDCLLSASSIPKYSNKQLSLKTVHRNAFIKIYTLNLYQTMELEWDGSAVKEYCLLFQKNRVHS